MYVLCVYVCAVCDTCMCCVYMRVVCVIYVCAVYMYVLCVIYVCAVCICMWCVCVCDEGRKALGRRPPAGIPRNRGCGPAEGNDGEDGVVR